MIVKEIIKIYIFFGTVSTSLILSTYWISVITCGEHSESVDEDGHSQLVKVFSG